MRNWWAVLVSSGLMVESSFALAQAQKVDNIGNRGGIVVSGERLAGAYRMEQSSEITRTQTDTSQIPPLVFSTKNESATPT
jgi:hypothetical protein